MDPNVTWKVLVDLGADTEDRYQAAIDLQDWLRSGGFLPDGVDLDTAVAMVGGWMRAVEYRQLWLEAIAVQV